MKKRFLALVLACALCLSLIPGAVAAGSSFDDVPSDAWYASAVASVCESGLFNGTSATTFSPDGTLSLAQAIVLAARLHQYLTEGSVTLASGEGAWYDTFLTYAKAKGIVTDFYDPYLNEDATRSEMVQIFYQALPASAYEVINDVEDNAIPDVKLSYDCGEAVYAFYRAGILTGSDRTFKVLPNGSNYFKPWETIHRSEVAAILDRVLHPEKRQSVALQMPQLPDKNGKVTIEALLAVVENYAPDVAFIIRENDRDYRNGEGFINGETFRMEGSCNFADYIRTAQETGLKREDEVLALNGIKREYREFGTELYRVLERKLANQFHEEIHAFFGGCTRGNVYLGDGKYISVPATAATYKTEEMADLLPEKLRTDRYVTYVGKGTGASANRSGIYGLLDEFTAYYWSNRNEEEMLDYYLSCYPTNEELKSDRSAWINERDRLGGVASNYFESYAEFRFWILSYMLYAKEHYPETYQGVLADENFRLAYTYIDREFAGVIERFFTRLAKSGRSNRWKGEYDTLMEIMARPEYVEMQSLLTCDLSILDTVRLPQGVTK